MELVKREDRYDLYADDGSKMASTSNGKLSLKNCQAIELGYDLDEIWEKLFFKRVTNTSIRCFDSFKLGFQKALELIGDKKFSEDDVILIAEYVRVASQSTPDTRTKDLFDEYQSLQQTEWDVEIVSLHTGDTEHTTNTGLPKLDADGFLILKPKS